MHDHSRQFLNNSGEDLEDYFEKLVQIIPVPVGCSYETGEIIFLNKKFTEFFGYTLADIPTIDDWFKQAYPDKNYREESKKLWFTDIANYKNKLTDKPPVREYIIATKHGLKKNVEISFELDKSTLYVIFVDITKRKTDEIEIHRLLTAVIQNPASIIITDLEGNIEYVNPKFCKITGYTTDEVIGKNPRILKTDNLSPDSYKQLWETITSGGTWQGEFLNKKKNGDLYWEFAVISPIKDDKGEIINYLAIKEDITTRKNTELALIKSEKRLKQLNATKDKFFSIIAHDLKNPFANILTLSELILSEKDDKDMDKFLKMVDLIYLSSKAGFDLLNNLLEWALTQTGRIAFNPTTISCKLLVNEVKSILADSLTIKNITLQSDFDQDLTLFADRNMMQTVLRNLVSNAIKFSFDSGEVIISITKESDKTVVSVKDNGIGISQANISRLFKIDEQFTTSGTANETGTGLGLILCKEFIQLHGGNIWAESEVGNGAKIVFTIPNNDTVI